jgi:hypothetical protein
VEVEEVGVADTPDLTRQGGERRRPADSEDFVDVGVVGEERDVLPFREHADPRARVAGAEGAEQRRGQEDIPDGAEPNHQDIDRQDDLA